MPINKKDNKKNAPVSKRDSAKVPTKEHAVHTTLRPEGTIKKVATRRVTGLTTAGKKKKPK